MHNTKPDVIFFDVYDTLLDMSEIKRRINSALDTRRGYLIWFELLMQYCFLDNCIGQFHEFTALCKATLQMAGKSLGVHVPDNHIEDIVHLMKYLPLQEGVPKCLSQLSDSGYRLAALTNAPKEVIWDRMERTGLESYFEKVMSAEEKKKFKPACEVYHWAAKSMSVEPGRCLLVTTHNWDVAGAHYAGMKTAYIQRPQQMIYPLGPEPTIVLTDVAHLVQSITEKAD